MATASAIVITNIAAQGAGRERGYVVHEYARLVLRYAAAARATSSTPRARRSAIEDQRVSTGAADQYARRLYQRLRRYRCPAKCGRVKGVSCPHIAWIFPTLTNQPPSEHPASTLHHHGCGKQARQRLTTAGLNERRFAPPLYPGRSSQALPRLLRRTHRSTSTCGPLPAAGW